MRPLMLDFQPRRRSSPLGWSLLAGGVVLALTCIVIQQQVSGEAEQQQGHLQTTQRVLTGDTGAKVNLTPAETREQAQNLAEMRKVSQQLRRPWERLFATLEAMPRDNIALLTLTPDARKGQVRISAEARDLDAMLDFHRRLEACDELSDVSLLSHEIVANVPEHPVQFNLSATWEIGDANP
ncbi:MULTISPECIES: pilus assembly protein [Pseudomonas]|jgi:Tfp pilus assembly protein PilN|uniref:pilus assembly protein n=1 Tax=Pseudomonas TaxID=286 RepID=UPI000D8857C0|nr:MULTISPECIES: pilus assembly protein [Pseudomonas]MBD0677732.1 pilus assembly protein [Pseudomonas sp. PSB11]MCK8684998.1 pilus assembly protein [Pseudomonas umsongensis]MDP9686953.1 Tfp pilus assembly protein PilN [Pseudomonas mohnii]